MARRDHLGLIAVRTEGAILPPSILQRIHREDTNLGGLKAEDYCLAGDRIREAASRAWTALQGPWAAFQGEREKLTPTDVGTGMTRTRWLSAVLRELHYGPVDPLRESLKVGEREFPVSHLYGHAPLHLVGCHLDLDRKTPGAIGAARMSPHGMVQLLLNASEGNLWGVVSNGLRWRLLRDDNSLSRQSMVEFDLEAIMEGQLYDEFLLFFLVNHQSRLRSERPEECWLEKWSQAAGEEGKRALNTLRDGVQKAIEALGQGFLQHPANQELRRRIREGELGKQDYYRQILRMVYRFLFLFVSEDRGLLLDPKAAESAKELYFEFFSTRRVRLMAERMHGSARHHDLFASLKIVLGKLGEPEGCPELALPALGGFIFSEVTAPDLDPAELSNADLLESVRCLAVTREGGRLARVAYKNMGTEELGSVYESLLELHPDLATDGTWFKLQSVSGNERKTTGSYYTPDSLIQCLLDTALDPVVDDALKKAGTDPGAREKALLDLRIVDPAVGSGHFLIAAAHRLAKRLAQIRAGEDEPTPDVTRHAIRDVIGRCLHGVDRNPMAAELCKVSLWIEALEPGRPLSFLDHHIQVGDSLVGATAELVSDGIPDGAFEPLEGDDRPYCTALKRRNRAEREGLGGLFSDQDEEDSRKLAESMALVEDTDDSAFEGIEEKKRRYELAIGGTTYWRQRLVLDSWCAAFVLPKGPGRPDPPTTGLLRELASANDELALQYASLVRKGDSADVTGTIEATLAAVAQAANDFRFFHWHLQFPDVWREGAVSK